MEFIKSVSNVHGADKKKSVGARVSEIVVAALNSAESECEELGLSFSISRIIEEALDGALLELKEKIGIDYYELIKWQNEMQKIQDRLYCENVEPIDFNEYVSDLKIELISTADFYPESYDFNRVLAQRKDALFNTWSEELEGQGLVLTRNGDVVENKVQHTVETLSKTLKKSTDDVIEILEKAGVKGKDKDSHISYRERQTLLESLTNDPRE
jgi:hypothetical protein